MALEAALELSIEQLISALNKKIFMECTRVQSVMPPTSRALVATLTTEVRSSELGKKPSSSDEVICRSMLWRNEPKKFYTKSFP